MVIKEEMKSSPETTRKIRFTGSYAEKIQKLQEIEPARSLELSLRVKLHAKGFPVYVAATSVMGALERELDAEEHP